MSIRALAPILVCGDVQASIPFYRDLLGMAIADRDDAIGRTGWASLRLGQAHLMLASPTYLPEAPTMEGRYPQSLYYFFADDLEAIRRRLLGAGHAPGEITTRSYGMEEFEVVDPDGHMLIFGRDAPASGSTAGAEQPAR
ncbi:MAG: VOC family protein [Planctomycetota bacterium]